MSLTDTELAYHLRQFDAPYASTEALRDFIREQIGGAMVGSVMDVGCGAGANLYWMGKWGMVPEWRQVCGIDGDADLIFRARTQSHTNFRFIWADFYEAMDQADYTLSIQTLSFIEDWRRALTRLLRATRRWSFVTSLFWPNVETHCHARQDSRIRHYNVISTGDFAELAQRLGAQEIRWHDYEAPTPLEAPPERLGSRTVAGLTLSGPILMPWKFAAIRMRE